MIEPTVFLDAETARALRQLAKVEGRSQAEIIREALERHLKPGRPPQPKHIGRCRSGREDVDDRAEELLDEASREGKGP